MRLYYDNAYLSEFSSRVVGSRDDAAGLWVALEDTAFYPESGGQPADRGTLGGAQVLDVQADQDGTVWHLLSSPVSGEVDGAIDFARRFDHMPQHAARRIATQAAAAGARAPDGRFTSARTFHLRSRGARRTKRRGAGRGRGPREPDHLREPIHHGALRQRSGAGAAGAATSAEGAGRIRVVTVEDFSRSRAAHASRQHLPNLDWCGSSPWGPSTTDFALSYLGGFPEHASTTAPAPRALEEVGRLLMQPPLTRPPRSRCALANCRRPGRAAIAGAASRSMPRHRTSSTRQKTVFDLRTTRRGLDDLRDSASAGARRNTPRGPFGRKRHRQPIAVARPDGDEPPVGEAVRALAGALGGRGGGSPLAAQALPCPRDREVGP